MKKDIFFPLRKIVRFIIESELVNNFAYPLDPQIKKALTELNKTVSTQEHKSRLIEEFDKAANCCGQQNEDDRGDLRKGCNCK